MRTRAALRVVGAAIAVLSLSACQHDERRVGSSQASAAPSCSTVRSTTSGPGKAWLAQQGWRFASAEDAETAYSRLVEGASPWPDWYEPREVALPPGTRFQMALSAAQANDEPGGFGTFDFIDELSDVRDGLAVREEWKADVGRVVTYEVVLPLPARVGPVGAQVDPRSCRLLWGRLSQLEMVVPREDRMKFLRIVEERAIPAAE